MRQTNSDTQYSICWALKRIFCWEILKINKTMFVYIAPQVTLITKSPTDPFEKCDSRSSMIKNKSIVLCFWDWAIIIICFLSPKTDRKENWLHWLYNKHHWGFIHCWLTITRLPRIYLFMKYQNSPHTQSVWEKILEFFWVLSCKQLGSSTTLECKFKTTPH